MLSPSKYKRINAANLALVSVRPFVRWHRRLGLTAALAILLLSTTGIALNHVDDLYQPNEYIQSDWLLDWYNISPSTQILGDTEQSPKILWMDGTITLDEQAILYNQAPLMGVLRDEVLVTLFTQNTIHLFSHAGEKVESYEFDLGSNEKIIKVLVNTSSSTATLVTENQLTSIDLDKLSIQTTSLNPGNDDINLTERIVDQSNNAVFQQASRRYTLLKSKVLLDLHSGLLFGSIGKWLMDFFALCFFLLSVSGIVIWWRRRNQK